MAVFDDVMFFPSLLKKDGVYYAWMKVAGGPKVREERHQSEAPFG